MKNPPDNQPFDKLKVSIYMQFLKVISVSHIITDLDPRSKTHILVY